MAILIREILFEGGFSMFIFLRLADFLAWFPITKDLV